MVVCEQKEFREKLEPYKGKRIEFTGVYGSTGKYTSLGGQTVCIQNLKIGEERICNHVWVQRAENFVAMGIPQGQEIKFSAIVNKYPVKTILVPETGSILNYNYSLSDPTAIKLIHEPEEFEYEELPEPQPEPQVAPPVAKPSKLEFMQKIVSLSEEAGGWDKLIQIIDILKS